MGNCLIAVSLDCVDGSVMLIEQTSGVWVSQGGGGAYANMLRY